ncbi:hypothetical protein JM658_11985 [Joostella atrarenae]|uniref:Uncharacterized protein n=1 Tax=Joostella atrarenae TaxID=679257 RepID=A0ABS9J584_9FLAO|nr:hypothetical protein [Joostella atrarenae]MCF8715545.1 hypothetical protein [Joostella atrarenae]
MNVFYKILAIVMAFSSVSYAQDFTITAPKSPKDDWCDFSYNGNFYTIESGASNTTYKTKIVTYDQDFNVISELPSDRKLRSNELSLVSDKGTAFAFSMYDNENRLGVLNKGGFHKLKSKDSFVQFITNQKVIIARMEENILGTDIGWKIEVTDMSTEEIEKFEMEAPTFRGEKLYGAWLMDYKEDRFKIAYINKSSEEKNFRNYIAVEYDFKGKIIDQQSIEVFLKDSKFSFLNDHPGAYDTYGSVNSSMVTAVNSPLANGVLYYDRYDDAYYAFGGYERKRDVSGIYVHKYDTSGKLVWKQQYPLDDFKLKYLNSYNRILNFDIGPTSIGMNLYTRKGKDYCGFYLVDKENGGLIGSKILDHYELYKWSHKYNTIFAPFESKDTPFKDLVFNRFVVYGMLEDPSFAEFVEQMQEDYLLKAYWNVEGLNVLYTKKKKSPEIYFKSFKNSKSL